MLRSWETGHFNRVVQTVKRIWEQTHLENELQFTITVVKKLLEVIRKRKKVCEKDSYLPEMVNSYVFTEHRFTICSCSESASPAVEADNSWFSPCQHIFGMMENCKVKPILGDAPAPVLRPRVVSLTLPHWEVLVERRQLDEEWHIACFLVPIVFADREDASSVGDRIWTEEHFDEFGSSPGCNSGFCHVGKHVCRVSNSR